MSEYKRWKHAAWALVFMAACARDTGDEVTEDESEHRHDEDEETEEDADRANMIARSRTGTPDPAWPPVPSTPGSPDLPPASSNVQRREGEVTINGKKVERGTTKPGSPPTDGACKLTFGKSSPQEARDIFGEPSWTGTAQESELFSFYYESGAQIVLEFVGGRLNNIIWNSSGDTLSDCSPSFGL